MSVRVLFVCMGNICRSPTGHALFREAVTAAGLDDEIAVRFSRHPRLPHRQPARCEGHCDGARARY